MSPLQDAIIQNTPGYSQAYAAGVPPSFSWCAGTTGDSRPPPAEFRAVTAWGQVYPMAGVATSKTNTADNFEVRQTRTYVHLSGRRQWVLIQDQTHSRMEGGHFVGDFAGNRTIPMTITSDPDGTALMGLPPAGFNSHFWIAKRGTFKAGSVDGVYVQMQIRAPDPDAKFVANVGVDWWRDSNAKYVTGFTNNPGAGLSNWVVLSQNWSTLYFYSLPLAKFRANPPPPLAGSITTLRFQLPSAPNAPSPCLPVEKRSNRAQRRD
jgi:hypothetical protein